MANPFAGSGLGARIVSAAVMAAVVLVALSAGATVFAVLTAAGAAVLAWEWIRLTGEGRFGPIGAVLATAVVAVVILTAAGHPVAALATAALAGGVMVVLARTTGRMHPVWIGIGALYIGVPAVALIWLRDDADGGRSLILWLLLTVWATDIGAFFAGRLIGGPRLAPRISPKKTWAGLMGGIVSAACVGVVVPQFDSLAPPALSLALSGAVLAVVAQGGDLGESWVKRRFGAKDSSQLIPGHGGLFDRVDGLLTAAVVLAIGQWLSGGLVDWR